MIGGVRDRRRPDGLRQHAGEQVALTDGAAVRETGEKAGNRVGPLARVRIVGRNGRGDDARERQHRLVVPVEEDAVIAHDHFGFGRVPPCRICAVARQAREPHPGEPVNRFLFHRKG